jgi:hypothetical protein
MKWIKSSRSGGGSAGSACVELARTQDRVLVRDSKDPDGPRLDVTPTAWSAFLSVVKR